MTNSVLIDIRARAADALAALDSMNRRAAEAGSSGGGFDKLKGALLSLAPAAAPVVASVVPLAAATAAAGVAVAAFTSAVGPQVAAMGDAVKAQDKYNASVAQYGPNSKQAQRAAAAVTMEMAKLPPATQRTAAAVLVAQEAMKKWSDDMSGFTMPVVTKAIGDMSAILPKTTGLVKGTATQFNRLVTLLGGAISSPGLDKVNEKFTAFATGTIKKAVDEIVHFGRVLSSGSANGPVQKFMDYARAQGPMVADLLKNLGEAVLHIAEAASGAGPGMLTVVNALAQLASAVPSEVLTRLIQLYTAMKLISATTAGVTAFSGAVVRLQGAMVAMRAEAAGSSGALAGLTAAFNGLSTKAKIGIVIAAVGATVLALEKLSNSQSKVTYSTDQMSTALKGIASGDTAQISPLIQQLTKDGDALGRSFSKRLFSNDSVWSAVTNPKAKAAKKEYDELDKSLASLVNTGKAQDAANALNDINKAGVKIPKKYLDDYNNALQDAQYEAKLTAQSMGVFGNQAAAVSKKLDAQSKAAQGLHDAIFALNDVNRSALDAENAFQQALDDGTAALKDHQHSLKFVNGELDQNSQKARDVESAMSKIASTAQDAASAALSQGKSQDYANKILITAHDQLVRMGQAAGLARADAERLADQLDNIHDPKIRITAQSAVLKSVIADANSRLAALARRKTSPAIRADSTQLKNVIRDAEARLAYLNGRVAETYVRTTYSVVNGKGQNMAHEGGGYAHGGVVGTAAVGGPRSNLTWVGEQGPELVSLAPGSSVHTAGDSARMAAGAGSSARPLAITLKIGEAHLGEIMIDPIRNAVWTRGGNVQAVLGRG